MGYSPFAFELRGDGVGVLARCALLIALSAGIPLAAYVAAIVREPNASHAQLPGMATTISEYYELRRWRVLGCEVHVLSLGVLLATHVFYVCVSTAVQLWFYRRQAGRAEAWKIQPKRQASLACAHDLGLWWLPAYMAACGQRFAAKVRLPRHALRASLNLSLSALVTAGAVELAVRGKTFLSLAPLADESGVRWGVVLGPLAWGTACGFAAEQAAQYYWHRAHHHPALYRRWHKIHHGYRAPEPFDDLSIHWLEGLLYYFMLVSPPMLFAIHVYGFALYFAVHGLTGILDHCGVRLRVPLLYDAADHDKHHARFECNYATPFPFMDILHGTYCGTWAGIRFTYLGADAQAAREASASLLATG